MSRRRSTAALCRGRSVRCRPCSPVGSGADILARSNISLALWMTSLLVSPSRPPRASSSWRSSLPTASRAEVDGSPPLGSPSLASSCECVGSCSGCVDAVCPSSLARMVPADVFPDAANNIVSPRLKAGADADCVSSVGLGGTVAAFPGPTDPPCPPRKAAVADSGAWAASRVLKRPGACRNAYSPTSPCNPTVPRVPGPL